MAMASRRCAQMLIRHHQCFKSLTTISRDIFHSPANALHGSLASTHLRESLVPCDVRSYSFQFSHHFCTKHSDEDDNWQDDSSEGEESCDEVESPVLTAEGKETEAAEIGYRVIGPLQKTDQVFRRYRPVFAVVQIGSHQFKVSNDDCIYTERLKYCDVNEKLLLNKVLLLGSKNQTIIGRPLLPDAAVHAVVEEHALDAKVIVFKKKRRKNYRRTKGHRQELTKLRIIDIQGIDVPESNEPVKKEKKQKLETLPHLKIPLKTQKKDWLPTAS